MGQWQVSITSTPPSSTLTLCSSRSKALAAFFCLFLPPVVEDGREGGGGDHPGTVPSWNAPILGREAETPGRVLQTTEGLKAVSGENAQGDTEI